MLEAIPFTVSIGIDTYYSILLMKGKLRSKMQTLVEKFTVKIADPAHCVFK